VLYKKGSGSKNNNVDFMSITELRKFRESKVGISRDLLNSLRTNMKKYFEKVPEFKVFPLEDYTGKMKTLDDRFLWKYMAKQQLNIFYDNNVERARNIATNLARQLKASPTIQANQIQIKLSDHACPGLNIQIIQDDYGSEEDAYEISGEEKIIQHITVQKFHQFEDGHELSDITMDSKINKVAQELVIKQDLVSQTLTPVTGDLLDTTAKYEFYNFRYIKEKPLTIQVAKISFQTDRKFSIKSEQVVLENESQSELSVICHRVYHYVLNGPKRSAANKEYRWKTVAGVISSGEGLVAIQNVERQTLPDSEWLFDQLVTDNPEKQFDVRELGRVLKQLQCKHGVEDEYSE
ncbi:hypothetical protein, partial [Lactiplantibacillus garii]|uniref:hypothetical protein n=1 Tax=Lactiplantibacillus garii TaxID=2306423 RepID=UPI0013152A7F